MMKRNPLPKNADELLAPGEAVAAVLAETKSNGTSRQKSKRCCGARVRPHSIRFSKVWGGGGRPSLVDARSTPVFSRGSESPLTMNQGGPNHAKDKTEHY